MSQSELSAPLPGSFRDPAGQIYELDGRIFRCITGVGAPPFEKVRATGFLDTLVGDGMLLPYGIVSEEDILARFPQARYLLEHPRLDYVSFPYEWSFSQLKEAALLHLDIALAGLDKGVSMSDASAYNIQFIGSRPVFIDHLSFKPYVEGEFWMGHRQFCEQFLNPLLLRAKLDIAHNSLFRGTLEGVTTDDLSKLLRPGHKMSLRMFAHVVLPARFQRRELSRKLGETKAISERKGLPLAAYKGLLGQLRGWIDGLVPKGEAQTVWGTYAEQNTYEDIENSKKAAFIDKFIRAVRPGMTFDLGCNSGAFSEVALKAGSELVVGFDFDQVALDKAYARAKKKSLNLLPLFLDAANPSPSQGWRQAERPGFFERAKADAVLALAFEHHLAIGKNVPLPQVVEWITSLAPSGIIEFVDKKDPTIRAMLAMREDIFHDYSQERFEEALSGCAEIVEKGEVTKDGRTLYWYRRKHEHQGKPVH